MRIILLVSLLAISFGVLAESDIEKQQTDVRNENLTRLKQGLDRELTEKSYAEAEARIAERFKKPAAKIGMTSEQVRNNTYWGEPLSINETETANTTIEQWVYRSAYLYFTNGKLTAIQTSK